MDWANERYVRVYTRDTTTWKLMDWRGRAVLQFMIRKVDRAGVLDVGQDGVLGLAAVLELPLDIVEAGIKQLTTVRVGGPPTVVDTGSAFVLPNFIEAQETPQSDPQRKRESRARRREVALATSRKLLTPGESDLSGHETSRPRDEIAEVVTPILIRSDPDPTQTQGTAACVLPESIAKAETRRKFIWTAWELAGNAFKELGKEGIEPTAPDAYAGIPNAGSEGMRRLAAIADLLLIGDQPDLEAALATVRRRIEVGKIQGRVKNTRRYLAPVWMWKADSFEIDASQSPEQAAAQARAGPRGNHRPPPDPVRKIKTL